MTSPGGEERDDGFRDLSEADLEDMLTELEQQVSELGAELARRHRELRRAQDQAAQHAQIERLGEHLVAAQVNWQKVLEFFRSAIKEQRAGVPWNEPPETTEIDTSHTSHQAPAESERDQS